MAGPLHGVKILDMTSMISGPTTTLILADQGAEVIKVENPNYGDHTRIVSTRQNGFSASFLNNNRNKKSVAIDLKSDKGIGALKKLVADCDVFIQNFRPGVIDRMGLGEDVIREIVPNIIYCSISGFGHEGPYAKKPVYDPLIQALSGLATVQGGSDDVRPRLVRTILPDKLTGYAASQAITAALFSRTKTGEGQHIRLSMLDAIISFLWGSDMGGHTFVGNELKQETAQSFIDLIYETKEGYISVAVQSDKEWKNLCAALDKPEWLEDPRFLNTALRHKNINDRLTLTQEALLEKTASEWLGILETHDVPSAPVLSRTNMIRHPQIEANGIIAEIDHPEAGRLRQARPAPQFSKTPTAFDKPAPQLGEHTVEMLRLAGVEQSEIDTLLDEGVLKAGEGA
ncbi:MAG: CoA transferase [Hyphomicrobiales bacterium]